MSHVWDFQTVFASWPLLSQGLLNTLKLGLLTLITGLFFGLFVGLGRYSRNRWVNFPASVFVEVFRNTPALVQIMWFYFAFPIISPFDIDAFSAAALGLGSNTTAFCAEIFRWGI
jgi:polar amino acid transport system permease protein